MESGNLPLRSQLSASLVGAAPLLEAQPFIDPPQKRGAFLCKYGLSSRRDVTRVPNLFFGDATNPSCLNNVSILNSSTPTNPTPMTAPFSAKPIVAKQPLTSTTTARRTLSCEKRMYAAYAKESSSTTGATLPSTLMICLWRLVIFPEGGNDVRGLCHRNYFGHHVQFCFADFLRVKM